ncbi:amino acid permease-associated region [Halobacillus halophilus DSM 2266]|uniref:Amino acid permease-associated region n=1 Tax=Halobacillus halophilus (strain ATCC 35676 / DSM 2266 / JCM 20832 / KCTC 3685 / LMG 17431 / NBRC 102448 / NCIMB 2269) TaxID=866895 RepID=I0JKS6_HALH3|nr:amino acid permease-associated region [Halobacillus halophilus DSM 2266]
MNEPLLSKTGKPSISYYHLPEMERPFRAAKSPIFGYLALVLSLGFIILYFPDKPASLIWPYEWIMVTGWTLLGAYFFIQMLRGTYQKKMSSSEEKAL